MTAEPLIHVINLDRSPERMAFVQAEFDKAGLGGQVRRFAAIDARSADFTAPGYSPHGRNDRWEMEVSERAVFESHRALWAEVRDSGKSAVICEDDILVSPGFGDALGALDIDRFGVVKLDGFNARRRYGPVIELNGQAVRPILEPVPSAACYAIAPKAAGVLLDASGSYCATLDDFLFVERPGLAPVQLFPAVAVQGMCCVEGASGPIPGQIAESERDGPGKARKASKGPATFRLRKEIRRLSRKLSIALGSDRRLIARGGIIDCPPLAEGLPPYRL